MLYNLNSKTLSENVTKILEKGPHCFCTRKYNEHEDQIDAEYLYNQISKIAKEHCRLVAILIFKSLLRNLKYYVNRILENTKNGTITTRK